MPDITIYFIAMALDEWFITVVTKTFVIFIYASENKVLILHIKNAFVKHLY